MQLIWLHGAPAVGKLTVAKALQQHHGCKLFHNHLAVDLSLAIYDEFGEKDFHDFTNTIRRTAITKANALGVSRMVMTYMTCSDEDAEEISRYLNFFRQEGIDVYPIHLCPEHEVVLARSVTAERQNSHKISCPEQLGGMLNKSQFKPISHENALSIDNSQLPPEAVAQMIIEHLP